MTTRIVYAVMDARVRTNPGRAAVHVIGSRAECEADLVTGIHGRDAVLVEITKKADSATIRILDPDAIEHETRVHRHSWAFWGPHAASGSCDICGLRRYLVEENGVLCTEFRDPFNGHIQRTEGVSREIEIF